MTEKRTRKDYRTLFLDLDELLEKFEGGSTITELAREFGLSYGTIRNKLAQKGVTDFKRRYNLPSKEVLAEELKKEGGMKALHKKYNMSYATFRTQILKMGLEPKGELRSPIEKKAKDSTPKILELYEEGTSSREISKKVGLSHQGVINRLRDEGVEIRNRGFSLSKCPEKEDLAEMLENNATLIDLCTRFDVSEASMRKYLKRYDLSSPRHSTEKSYPIEKVWAEYQAGAILTELAEKYGGCAMTIRRHLKKAGYELRKQGARRGGSEG
jgi:transposase-like protein